MRTTPAISQKVPLLITSQVSLGEMVAYLPIPGGHIKLAERFVDPALSFTMGWNYWYVVHTWQPRHQMLIITM